MKLNKKNIDLNGNNKPYFANMSFGLITEEHTSTLSLANFKMNSSCIRTPDMNKLERSTFTNRKAKDISESENKEI